jgi:hypothetical protein
MWPHRYRLIPSAEVKQELLDLIEMAFTQAGLLDQTPHQKGGLAVVEALLQSREVSISAAGEQWAQGSGCWDAGRAGWSPATVLAV